MLLIGASLGASRDCPYKKKTNKQTLSSAINHHILRLFINLQYRAKAGFIRRILKLQSYSIFLMIWKLSLEIPDRDCPENLVHDIF
jgi:hypothetical protein